MSLNPLFSLGLFSAIFASAPADLPGPGAYDVTKQPNYSSMHAMPAAAKPPFTSSAPRFIQVYTIFGG